MLIQYDWHPSKKKLGHRQVQKTDYKGKQRRWASISPGGKPQRKPAQPTTPWSQTSSSENCKKINSCGLEPLSLQCFVTAALTNSMGSAGGTMVKNLPSYARDTGSIPGWGRSLEKEMATHSSILAWRIPGTEEPSGPQSIGSQRVGHDWARRSNHIQKLKHVGTEATLSK